MTTVKISDLPSASLPLLSGTLFLLSTPVGLDFVSERVTKSDLADTLNISPALTGTPTAPTAAPGTNSTQIATTAYADAAATAVIAAADAMVFKGVIDCSTNPNYPAADRGHTYRVSVAGKIGGASGLNVEAGDILLCLTDGTASGTQAVVGANWSVIQTNLDGAVIGPASAVDSRIAAFDGTTGKLLKDSGVSFSAGVLAGANGGTGVANSGKTITLGGNLTTSGAFDATLTLTAATNITLPTTGTLATLDGVETLRNKTLSGATTLPGSGQISSSGSLGIGSPPAVGALWVQGSSALTYLATTMGAGHRGTIMNSDTTANNMARIALGGFDIGGTGRNGVGFTAIITARTVSSITADLAVQTTDAGTTGERLRIASAGNIGVGNFSTNAPQALLHIGTTAGTARIYNSFTDASNGEWAYLGDWGASANVATFGPDKNGTGTYRPGRWVSGGIEIWRSRTNGDFQIGTGSAIATNATGGFVGLPTCNGTPTGTPTNAAAGIAHGVINYATQKLNLYINGGWYNVALTAGAG